MKKLEDHYSALDQFTDEAIAGATDDWLAEHAETSISMVTRWRNERGIQKVVTPDPLVAIQNLSSSYDPAMHVVGSVFEGNWSPPQYVIRSPMNYTEFCRIVHMATHDAGIDTASVASGLGVREQDVSRAAAAWKAHLKRRGRRCQGCNTVVDPKFGPFCMKRCRDAAAQK